VVPFRGTFDHTLDAKNRLTVPARYRAALAEGVVLAMPVDLTPCVGVWRPEEYETYTRRALAELPPLSSRLTELERFFYGSSLDAELDAAGRIMIPNSLRESASLAKDVIVVGVGDRLELWGKSAWNEHRSTLLSGVAEVTARVDDAA
jgi:MraZ protein